MVRLPPGDEASALRLPCLDPVLSRELHGSIHGFASGPDKVRPAQAVGIAVQQGAGKLLCTVCSECQGVGVGDLGHLFHDGGFYIRVAMAYDGHGGTGAAVEYALPGGEGVVASGGSGDCFRAVKEQAMEDFGGFGLVSHVWPVPPTLRL